MKEKIKEKREKRKEKKKKRKRHVRRETRQEKRRGEGENEKRRNEKRRKEEMKTPLCVRSKRLRVYGQDVSVCTGNRPECLSMDQENCLILGQVSLSLLFWKKNFQTEKCGPGGRLTGKQLTSRPDHLWPELWEKMGMNAKLREQQKWSTEKPKLDNARRLQEIYFIDPEDKEFKETVGNARKKLEAPMAPATPCKTCKKSKKGETRSKTNDFKSKFACILEASESMRMRMEESLPNYHEDHIAGKGDNSLQHYNLVHKFISMPQAMKILAAKEAVDKEWENLKRFRRGTKQESETNLK